MKARYPETQILVQTEVRDRNQHRRTLERRMPSEESSDRFVQNRFLNPDSDRQKHGSAVHRLGNCQPKTRTTDAGPSRLGDQLETAAQNRIYRDYVDNRLRDQQNLNADMPTQILQSVKTTLEKFLTLNTRAQMK